MNRTHPQNVDAASLGSTKSFFAAKRGCCKNGSMCIPCTRRCICVFAIALLITGVIAVIIALVVTVGIPRSKPGDLPNSLPGYLIFYCGNPRLWIYADKRCDGINDCGDCSDETGTWASCPPCGPHWWRCTMVVFHAYCACIPRSLCRDGVQHCSDWSDEYVCSR
ncbi:low-density lipoprotein receptor class A domain-containing protein 1-like isoform X2 [Eublepharis macularius]|uniref:Low-density lipoprotein receptor class A domain-containing protein 1-like isoform X2 n=1 Tax=Eublepharis macularius TaxID=481883 RepID=A0AA97JBY5_EUBMA|nr:low-density lipoprotein receptor class A domain-containing protein 1-like isoform X2 [Eublepharis macularius]